MLFEGLRETGRHIPASRSCALSTRVVSFLVTVFEKLAQICAAGLLLLITVVSGYAQVTRPSVTNIQPAGVMAGSGAVTVTILGTGFDPTSIAFLSGGQTLPTTFIDSGTLQATISSIMAATPN